MLVEFISGANPDARQVNFNLKELTLDPQISKIGRNLAQVGMQPQSKYLEQPTIWVPTCVSIATWVSIATLVSHVDVWDLAKVLENLDETCPLTDPPPIAQVCSAGNHGGVARAPAALCSTVRTAAHGNQDKNPITHKLRATVI